MNILSARNFFAITLLSIVSSAGTVRGQTAGSSSGVEGSASVGFELYDLESSPGGSASARRHPTLLRMAISPTVTIGEGISLPFNFNITVPETGKTEQRPFASSDVGDFLLNPSTMLGVSPTLGWAQLHLGSHAPTLTELSGGDVRLFGAGLDLAPGNFRIVASAGAVGGAVAPDTGSTLPDELRLPRRGEFARHGYMGRIAWAREGAEIGLNMVRIRDDGASIARLVDRRVLQPDPADPSLLDTVDVLHPLMPLPQESFTATINARVPVVEGITVAGELGGSLFTRDMDAADLADPITELEPFMRQRLSTRADLAGKIAVDIAQESWGISLTSLYIGPGYRTLAYPWMEADRLDLTASPRFQLFDNDLTVDGSIGWRRNNLGETEEETTSQLLASANADARFGELLGLNFQFSNFGLRTPVRNDTFRVESVSRSISLTPTVTLPGDDITQVISASVALDDYTDYNPISGAAGSNRMRSLTGIYTMSFAAIPLSLDLSGSWFLNQLDAGDLTITSGSVGGGYALFDGAITLGAGGSITRTASGTARPDEGTTLRLDGSWKITPALRLRADASTTFYSYGDSRPGHSFRENLVRTSLQWQW